MKSRYDPVCTSIKLGISDTESILPKFFLTRLLLV